jgi:hypothetical protein
MLPATKLCRLDGEEMTWARPLREKRDNFYFSPSPSCEGRKEKNCKEKDNMYLTWNALSEMTGEK